MNRLRVVRTYRSKLARTPARLTWLQAVVNGDVQAVRYQDHGVDVGPTSWTIHRCTGPMTNWLCDPEIRPLWRPVIDIAPVNEPHPICATEHGVKLLREWTADRS